MAGEQDGGESATAREVAARESERLGLGARSRRLGGRSRRATRTPSPSPSALPSAASPRRRPPPASPSPCVAHRTRSRTPRAASPTAHGSLFPLEDRDFAYSPFSTSTATDQAADSDHSLYTPLPLSRRARRRRGQNALAKRAALKRRTISTRGGTDRDDQGPSPTKRRKEAPPVAGTSSAKDKSPERREYPLRSGRKIPLKRDRSVSSTASEASSGYSGHLRQIEEKHLNSAAPTSPQPLPEPKTRSSRHSSRLANPSSANSETPSSKGAKAWAITGNLGARVGRTSGGAGLSTTSPSQPKRQSSRSSGGAGGSGGAGAGGGVGLREGLRRSTRASGADMPQQAQPSPHSNNKRDKKGKGSLGSCASSGGSSAGVGGTGAGNAGAAATGGGAGGGRRSVPTPSHHAATTHQNPHASAVASTSSNRQQSGSPANMAGGTNADSKSKTKEDGVPVLAVSAMETVALAGASVGESSSDDSEVGRLQALLEARGLPPHLLGALGPRMQHLLHRTMGVTTSSKAAQLLAGLQATGDEGQQLQAVIEMCQLLVMGNEDTLAGFPVRQVVPALITLLAMDHNFDMMNHACRALTYMMEALPHTSGAVALAVPVFLDKLQAISCMDVAEQSLTALDMLSRRHSKPILQARGVSSCLMYLDFFSINAQRAALSITSNCCQNLQSEEFLFIKESLPLLANRLTQQDKKSVESVCLAFSRLVDSYQNDPVRLQEIASTELLTNLQQLLVVSPPMISTVTFNTVLRMLSIMCSSCPELAVTLLRQNIADTLLFLLTGSTIPNPQEEVELVARSPPELYEITSLVAELMPHLPTTGIFAVDAFLERPWGAAPHPDHQAQWQWRDDTGVWHTYTALDSRTIEAAHQSSEDEVSLSALGRTYIVDFLSMKQINEDTGTTRPVQRRLGPPPTPQPADAQGGITGGGRWGSDARSACLRGSCGKRVLALSAVLLEVYSSSAGPAVRCQCLKALLRMVYHADPDMLTWVLKYQVVSSHIAGMMASNDLRIVVGSLQMAEILMEQLPDVFGTHFRREGVMHQIGQLADPSVPLCVSPPKSSMRVVCPNPTASGVASVKRDLTSGLAVHTLTPSTPGLKTKASISTGVVKGAGPVASVVAPSVISINLAPGTSHGAALIGSGSAVSIETSLTIGPNGSPALLDPTQPGVEIPLPTMPHELRSQSPVSMRLTDVLKRKRAPKRSGERASSGTASGASAGAGARHRRQEEPQDLPTQHHHHPHGSSFRSRLGGATSKTTSFLASLNPARWARQHGAPPGLSAMTRDSMQSNANIAAQNREKARQWVRTQAAALSQEHCGGGRGGAGGTHPASGVLSRLTSAVQRLRSTSDTATTAAALSQLRDVLVDSDISPFEVNHSGLVSALLTFLTTAGEEEPEELLARDSRLRSFLNVFADMPLDIDAVEPMFNFNPSSLSALVSKMNACVSQLEQFPVRVHDLPARPSTSALKFFNTHQLKCNLQRHPACTNLKQWKGGTVKIDPLALVQAIERYLVVRGYARQRESSGSVAGSQGTPGAPHQPPPDSDDDNTDEDIDDSLAAAVAVSQGRSKHKLQFMIGETVLPYNMTVYQAVRQFSPQANDQSETDTDTEAPLGNAGVWVQTHTIYYRGVGPEGATVSCGALGQSSGAGQPQHGAPGRKGKGTSTKSNNRRKTDDLWNEGIVPLPVSALSRLLGARLPATVTVSDAALPALALLRSLHALSRHWPCLYRACPQLAAPLLPHTDFINSKLAAKASRQLQDPLVIMTGNLPQWLQQVASACPFLFPFETRQLLFYAISFDRDRALQRLLDSSPELNHAASDSAERVTPRLDRRKRTVSRDHILKQAEQVIQDFAHSKALLEVKYENEVGTGLGPTLEFYALVSLELQRADLDLWHGSENFKQKPSSFGVDVVKSNQPVVIDDPADSPPPVDPTAHLASSVYNNLNLTEERNRNVQNANTDNFDSFDMPMILDTSDVNLNSEVAPRGRREAVTDDKAKDGQVVLPPSPAEVSYVNLACGLFPQALGRNTKVSQLSRIKAKFRFLGKFMAKAVMDSRMLDLPFSLTFYRWLVGEEACLGLGDIRNVAPELWRSLCRLQRVALHAEAIRRDTTLAPDRKREMLDALELDGCPIEELGLDFILPGHSCTELRRGGRDLPVTAHNLGQYISLVTHWLLYEGLVRQMDAFREGFESVFPINNLKMFYPEELEAIFCGTSTGSALGTCQRWEARTLAESCRPDHGFTAESRAIRFLLEILASYDTHEQRLFLQFITGSPRLPTGGFKALSPPLTVVRKTLDPNVNADDYLPSVMTCVNYLKLPDYSSLEVMRTKLRIAASEGQHSFHLS